MPIGPNGERLPYPSGFGGDIPSPRQKGDGNVRRPAAEGGNRMERERVAQLQSLLSQMQMPTPSVPGMSEMGSPVPGEGMNKPAMDINDAFFGPDRKPFQWTDIIDFLTKFSGGK